MAILGIDLGGTKVVLAVGDDEGTVLAHRRRPTPLSGDWEADLAVLVDEAQTLLRETLGGSGERLQSIGASVPGPTDPTHGVLLNPPNLPGWRDVPVGAQLAAAFGVAVHVENDANAAALAEAEFGAGRGSRDMIYLTMSTGVGGGVISGGRLLHGAFGGAGEAGHIPIEVGGRRCACGLLGCLEAYVGGNAWRAHLQQVVPDSSRVLELANGQRSAIGPETLVEAAREGDGFARAEFGRWLDHLTSGIVPLVMLLEPQRIVLGTIAVAAGEALCFAPLRERVAARLWPQQAERLEIVPAQLGKSMPQRAGLAVALAAGSRPDPSS